MKKRLTLLRHAKSSWNNPSLDDRDRPLNKRGERDAPMMGQRLLKKSTRPSLILTSPAKRARQTARLIAREIG
ncbi:MAG: histidine phosphatase family protein [Gammaproteobacteria bacterium]|nr:histidine phosphatase family protein [Gammaproteobacteria bacterium]